jgi:hypothetical protein
MTKQKMLKVTQEFYNEAIRMNHYIRRLYNPMTRRKAETFEEAYYNKILEIKTSNCDDDIIKTTKKRTWLHKHRYIEIIKLTSDYKYYPCKEKKTKIKINEENFYKYKIIIETEYYDKNLFQISAQLNMEDRLKELKMRT